MANITIVCKDCGKEFDFTEREQEFYAQNEWNQPIRCPECRQIAKKRREARDTNAQ